MLLTEKYKNRLQELAGIPEAKILSEVDNREFIVSKLGLTQHQADFSHNVDKKYSPKYSIWIANQLKNGAPENASDFRLILDWKKANPSVNLNNFDYKSALEASNKWHSEKFKVQDVEMQNKNIVLQTGPYFWVKLSTEEDCKEEGMAMGHCIAGRFKKYQSGIYIAFSMRDSNNNPHITIEIDVKTKYITEFKGKENKVPIAKYIPYAIEFLLKNKGLWNKITDDTFWNSLDKHTAKMFYKKTPEIFSFGLKMKYDLPLNKEEKIKYDEAEKFFVEQLNGCIEIKSSKYPNSVFLKKGHEVLFELEKKDKLFCTKYNKTWSILETKFGRNHKEIAEFMSNQISKHLNCKEFTPTYLGYNYTPEKWNKL